MHVSIRLFYKKLILIFAADHKFINGKKILIHWGGGVFHCNQFNQNIAYIQIHLSHAPTKVKGGGKSMTFPFSHM